MNRARKLLPTALLCAAAALICAPSGLLAGATAHPANPVASVAKHATASHAGSGLHRSCRSVGSHGTPRHRAGCSSNKHSAGKHSAAKHRVRRASRQIAVRTRAAKHTHAAPRAPRAAAPGGNSAQIRAAAVAAALASVCTNVEITPTPEDLALVRSAVLCLVNRLRAQHGEAPLVASPLLEQAAEAHCAEMISAGYFAHVSPSGETPVDRARATGYIPAPPLGYILGENLAWGTYGLATPQAIVAAWTASPEHLANMLEASYTETGVAVTAAVPSSLSGGSPGATYAQEFGVILR